MLAFAICWMYIDVSTGLFLSGLGWGTECYTLQIHETPGQTVWLSRHQLCSHGPLIHLTLECHCIILLSCNVSVFWTNVPHNELNVWSQLHRQWNSVKRWTIKLTFVRFVFNYNWFWLKAEVFIEIITKWSFHKQAVGIWLMVIVKNCSSYIDGSFLYNQTRAMLSNWLLQIIVMGDADVIAYSACFLHGLVQLEMTVLTRTRPPTSQSI